MDTKIEEIQENIFRICLRPPGSFISFNHFLIRDENPTLIHTGHKKTFADVYKEVAKLINPQDLRYIAFSHFEPDECGSLNEWLEAAPKVETCINKICDWSVKDFATKPSKVLKDDDVLDLGKHQLRMLETPHFPHAWEACLFYETTTKTLFSSDLGTQQGFKDASDSKDLSEEIVDLQVKLGYMPFGVPIANGLKKLHDLEILLLATMHGVALDQKSTKNLLQLLQTKNNEFCSDLFLTPV